MKAKDRVQPSTIPKLKRFPRLPKGMDVADLAKSVWTVPTFEVDEVDGVTNFVFRVRLRDKIQSENRELYWSLFESGGPTLRQALKTAYVSAHSGAKSVQKCMDIALYSVFRDALRTLMPDAKSHASKYSDVNYRSPDGKDYPTLVKELVENEITLFDVSSRRKKGRKRTRAVDETRPIRLAKRYATLEPQVNLLKQSIDALKATGIQDENLLRTEIGKAFKKHDWINHVVSGAAFLELPPHDTAMTATQSSLGGQWTRDQLITGILKCEDKALHRGRPLDVMTILKMISHGKKLLANSETARR